MIDKIKPAWTRQRRALKLAGVVLLGLLGFLLLLELGAVLSPWWSQRQSIRLLAEASSPAEIADATSQLGVVFVLRDGSWIAVRYQDSHGAWSRAVAVDSQGRWYVSRHHFCAAFTSFRSSRLAVRGSNPLPQYAPAKSGDEIVRTCAQIEAAESLDAAVAILERIWFVKWPDGPRPRFLGKMRLEDAEPMVAATHPASR